MGVDTEGQGWKYEEHISGFLAGVATVIVGQPFDTVKVKLQKHNTEVHGIKYRNGLHCTARILKNDGVRGLYRGTASSFAGRGFEYLLGFGLYLQAKESLQEKLQSSGPKPLVIMPSGAYAGAVVSFVLCPTELVKCRMQVQGADSVIPRSSTYAGPIDCALQTIKAEGVTGIFRGGVTTFLRDSLGNAMFFAVYEYIRHFTHLQLKDATHEHTHLTELGIGILTGGLGGVAYWSTVLPLDVAKTIIQTNPDRKYTRNPLQVLNMVYQQAGIRGCYAGLGPTIARAFPANAAAIVTWEFAMKILGIKHH